MKYFIKIKKFKLYIKQNTTNNLWELYISHKDQEPELYQSLSTPIAIAENVRSQNTDYDKFDHKEFKKHHLPQDLSRWQKITSS